MASSATDGDGTTLGPIETLVGYHLRRASAVFGTDFAQTLAGTGMRQVLFGIVSVVAANPGINQGAVGRALGIQRANMVSLINELVDRGLVERVVAAEDRRAFALTLTDAGQVLLETCEARLATHEARLLEDMTAAERATLVALLDRIVAKE